MDYIVADVHATAKAFNYVRQGFGAVVRKAVLDNGVKRLFILGDLWDHKDYLRFGSDFLLYFKSEVAPYFKTIYIMEGTPYHDYDGFEIFRTLDNVVIITEATYIDSMLFLPQKTVDNDIIPHVFNKSGHEIYTNATWEQLSELDIEYLFGHFYVQGATYNGIDLPEELVTERPIVRPEWLLETKAKKIFLGHIHTRNKKLESMGIRYCGSMYAKKWGETDTKAFYIVSEDSIESIPYGNPRKYILEDEKDIQSISKDDLYMLRKKTTEDERPKVRVQLRKGATMEEKFRAYCFAKKIAITDVLIILLKKLEKELSNSRT